MITLIRRWLAQRECFRLNEALAGINDDLYITTAPASRAALLDQAAAMEGRLAFKHPEAWGGSSASLAASSVLLRMLAASEHAAARPDEGSRYVFWCLDGEAEAVELDLWARLALTRNHAVRADLIGEIVNHAADRLGSDAVQSLIRAGFDTELELAAAKREGRKPTAPPMPGRKSRIAAGVFCGALIAYAAITTLLPYLK